MWKIYQAWLYAKIACGCEEMNSGADVIVNVVASEFIPVCALVHAHGIFPIHVYIV